MGRGIATWLAGWRAYFEYLRRGDDARVEWSVNASPSEMPGSWTILFAMFAALTLLTLWWHTRHLSRWRRSLLLGCRCLLVLTLGFMMEGWVWQRFRLEKPELAIVLDVSRSMSRVDEASRGASTESATRFDVARSALLRRQATPLRNLSSRYRLQLYLCGETCEEVPSKSASEWVAALRQQSPRSPQSALGGGLLQVLARQQGHPTAAVVLLSDGVNTSGPSLNAAANVARQRAVPVFALEVGSGALARETRIAEVETPDQVFVNDLVTFNIRLNSRLISPEKASLTLRESSRLADILAREEISFPAGEHQQEVRLRYRPTRQGSLRFEIALENAIGTAKSVADKAAVGVHVHNAQLRVLLVEGTPSYEFRYLKHLLERELNVGDEPISESNANQPRAGVKVVLQEADVRWPEIDKSAVSLLPRSAEEWKDYDVVVLGDADPVLFDEGFVRDLNAFVEQHGGGLLLRAGPRSNPRKYVGGGWSSLFPFLNESGATRSAPTTENHEYRVRRTSLGTKSDVLQLRDSLEENEQAWTHHLSGMYWFHPAENLSAGARVLLEHASERGPQEKHWPLLVEQNYGAGLVMWQGFDESYRWRARGDESLYARYWLQLVRHLARNQISLREPTRVWTDREQYVTGQPILVRARLSRDDFQQLSLGPLEFLVEHASGATRSVAATPSEEARNVFEARILSLNDGEYTVRLSPRPTSTAAATCRFQVVRNSLEDDVASSDHAALRQLTEVTRGQLFPVERSEELWAALPPGRNIRSSSLPLESLWNSPVVALLFVALVGAEWFLRKKWGVL